MCDELITIIVPIYNCEKVLERCIKSLINQTYKNIEILLINDGSQDRTLEICKKYALIDNRVKVIDKSNTGVSDTRNAGIIKARGKYIQFVDADDYIDLNMSQILIQDMKKNHSGLVICGYKIVSDSHIESNKCIKAKFSIKDDDENMFKYLYENCFINSPCNKLYLKESIKELFNNKISLGEDLDFNLKYIRNIESISTVENCLYNYTRENNSSLSSKYRDNHFDIIINIYNNFKKFCIDLDIQCDYIPEKILINNFYGAIQLLYENSKESNKAIIIQKYINEPSIKYAKKVAKLRKIDLLIFKILLNINSIKLIEYFFETKINLKKIIKGK